MGHYESFGTQNTFSGLVPPHFFWPGHVGSVTGRLPKE